jgi:hypothetical protein
MFEAVHTTVLKDAGIPVICQRDGKLDVTMGEPSCDYQTSDTSISGLKLPIVELSGRLSQIRHCECSTAESTNTPTR